MGRRWLKSGATRYENLHKSGKRRIAQSHILLDYEDDGWGDEVRDNLEAADYL